MAKARVQLNMDEELWRRSRALAILSGTTVSALIESYLRKWSGTEGTTGDSNATDHTESGLVEPDQDERLRDGDLGQSVDRAGLREISGV